LAASTVLLAAVELSTVSDGKLFGSVSPATRVPGFFPACAYPEGYGFQLGKDAPQTERDR